MSNAKSYSEFVTAVESGSVAQATLDGEQVRYRGTDGKDYVTIMPRDAAVTDMLIGQGVPVSRAGTRAVWFPDVPCWLAAIRAADRCLDLLHEPHAGRR